MITYESGLLASMILRGVNSLANAVKVTIRARQRNNVCILGVEAPARQGARSAHTGRMQGTSNAARRDASAFRMQTLFFDGSLPSRLVQRRLVARSVAAVDLAAQFTRPRQRHIQGFGERVDGQRLMGHCQVDGD